MTTKQEQASEGHVVSKHTAAECHDGDIEAGMAARLTSHRKRLSHQIARKMKEDCIEDGDSGDEDVSGCVSWHHRGSQEQNRLTTGGAGEVGHRHRSVPKAGPPIGAVVLKMLQWHKHMVALLGGKAAALEFDEFCLHCPNYNSAATSVWTSADAK
jgi:hypothetical protein